MILCNRHLIFSLFSNIKHNLIRMIDILCWYTSYALFQRFIVLADSESLLNSTINAN